MKIIYIGDMSNTFAIPKMIKVLEEKEIEMGKKLRIKQETGGLTPDYITATIEIENVFNKDGKNVCLDCVIYRTKTGITVRCDEVEHY